MVQRRGVPQQQQQQSPNPASIPYPLGASNSHRQMWVRSDATGVVGMYVLVCYGTMRVHCVCFACTANLIFLQYPVTHDQYKTHAVTVALQAQRLSMPPDCSITSHLQKSDCDACPLPTLQDAPSLEDGVLMRFLFGYTTSCSVRFTCHSPKDASL